MRLTIDADEVSGLSKADLAKLADNALHASAIVIKIPLCDIRQGSHLTDIAQGHLQLVFIAEELAKNSNSDVAYCCTGFGIAEAIEFEFTPSSPRAFHDLLVNTLFPYWRAEENDFVDLAQGYHDIAVTNPGELAFPELADDYLGNYVLSLDEQSSNLSSYESEEFEIPCEPEWEHGVFRSCQAAKHGVLAYTAIAMMEPSFGNLLICDEGDKLEPFLEAYHIVPQVSRASMIIDPRLRCRLEVFVGSLPPVDIGNKLIARSDDGLFEICAHDIAELQRRASKILPEENKILLEMTDLKVCAASGAIAVVYPKVTLVGWGSRCRPDSYMGIVKILEMAEHETIDWSQITADAFEELCYDYSEYLGYFDVRKLGKTNSRDGGRDLVAKKATRKTRFVPRKWIVQCRFSKKGASAKSVGTGNMPGISDKCYQYGARGYAVMTNRPVDPTLYDQLDAFERQGVIDDHEIFSIHEVERYLLRNPAAMQKYFGNKSVSCGQ